MAWNAGTITNAAPWATLSQKVKDLITAGPNLGNWAFVEQIPAGTGVGQSGSASYALDLFRCRGATTLYKRIVQKNLANAGSTTDGTSFPITVVTPAANRFITVWIANTRTAAAADDPTSISLDGSNAPTFTKIKSQASGAGTPILKGTLWIGKSGSSAPTGTILTITFPNTATGIAVIVDEWDGVDLTLGADGVDATGASKIGIQVVGNNGTNQTAHSATLAAMLGAQSVGVTWAAETASTTAYTNESGWTALGADISVATPTIHSRGQWRPDQDDLTGVLTTGGTPTDWACIAFEFQRQVESGSVTDPNDAGKDWYFVIEIPVTDGAVTSSMNSAENFNGNKLFRRMPPLAATATPVGSGYWRDDTLAAYASVTGNNRTLMAHQTLNTSGFSYWIKMTKNLILIATRVGAAERVTGAMLLDSVITNAADLPLVNVADGTSAASNGNSFSRLPGVVVSPGTTITGWQIQARPWTIPTVFLNTSNAADAQDLWASGKIHAARIAAIHAGGTAEGNSGANDRGFMRGLWKDDFRCIPTGGTVLLGDTMDIEGDTDWTVIGIGFFGSTGTDNLIILTRAI